MASSRVKGYVIAMHDRREARPMIGPEQGEWHQIGAHSFCLLLPDIAIVRPVGAMAVNEARRIAEILLTAPKPAAGFFYLSNLTQLGQQSVAAITISRDMTAGSIRAIAIVGATFHHKVASQVAFRAAKFLNAPVANTPTAYFETEEEALASFDVMRQK